METIIVYIIIGLTVYFLGKSLYKRMFSRVKAPTCSCGEKTCYDTDICDIPGNK